MVPGLAGGVRLDGRKGCRMLAQSRRQSGRGLGLGLALLSHARVVHGADFKMTAPPSLLRGTPPISFRGAGSGWAEFARPRRTGRCYSRLGR